MKKRIYISGSLSSLPKDQVEAFKRFYERLGESIEKLGCEVYVPHLHSDPEKHAETPPSDVYTVDAREVRGADLTICEMTIPSHGVGGEIEVAAQAGKEILLISQEGIHVSRFSRGNPAVCEHILYTDHDHALEKVNTWIIHWLNRNI